MLPDSTQQLIQKLRDLTRRNVIHWEHGPNDGERHFETEGYIVAISDAPTQLRILRPDGHLVEQADAAALAATHWPHSNLNRYDDAVRELMANAANGTPPKPSRSPALSAISAPTSKAGKADANLNKAIFGAIKSFDISSEKKTQDASNAPAYSPWLTT